MIDSLLTGLAFQALANNHSVKLNVKLGTKLGISALCIVGCFAIVPPAKAQQGTPLMQMPPTEVHAAIIHAVRIASTGSSLSSSSTNKLLPLTARKLEVPGEPAGLAQVSETLNARMQSDRTPSSSGLRLDSLPIVKEFVDESGNFDMGINLPFDISIDNVMGETGLVLSTEF